MKYSYFLPILLVIGLSYAKETLSYKEKTTGHSPEKCHILAAEYEFYKNLAKHEKVQPGLIRRLKLLESKLKQCKHTTTNKEAHGE